MEFKLIVKLSLLSKKTSTFLALIIIKAPALLFTNKPSSILSCFIVCFIVCLLVYYCCYCYTESELQRVFFTISRIVKQSDKTLVPSSSLWITTKSTKTRNITRALHCFIRQKNRIVKGTKCISSTCWFGSCIVSVLAKQNWTCYSREGTYCNHQLRHSEYKSTYQLINYTLFPVDWYKISYNEFLKIKFYDQLQLQKQAPLICGEASILFRHLAVDSGVLRTYETYLSAGTIYSNGVNLWHTRLDYYAYNFCTLVTLTVLEFLDCC